MEPTKQNTNLNLLLYGSVEKYTNFKKYVNLKKHY